MFILAQLLCVIAETTLSHRPSSVQKFRAYLFPVSVSQHRRGSHCEHSESRSLVKPITFNRATNADLHHTSDLPTFLAPFRLSRPKSERGLVITPLLHLLEFDRQGLIRSI